MTASAPPNPSPRGPGSGPAQGPPQPGTGAGSEHQAPDGPDANGPAASAELGPDPTLAKRREEQAAANANFAAAEEARCKGLRAAIDATLAADGLTIDRIYPELAKTPSAPAQRASNKQVRHRNPDKSTETWSGTGNVPRWVKRICTERGIEVDEFRTLAEFKA